MFFFFFQAEDGIRDYKVTGVQTCALPISLESAVSGGMLLQEQSNFEIEQYFQDGKEDVSYTDDNLEERLEYYLRSEERRVGEEGRSRWSPYHLKKKKKNNIGVVGDRINEE